jgi:hypothetical protein
MSWEERTGILEYKDGMVNVGYECDRCGTYWQMILPQDDYSEERMEKELCYACALRNRLAKEIKYARATKKKALEFMALLEEELDILKEERASHTLIIESGSKIITQQDTIIRDLKKRLGPKTNE